MRIAFFTHEHSEPDAVREICDALAHAGHDCMPVAYVEVLPASPQEHADLWILDWPRNHALAGAVLMSRQDSARPPLFAVIERGQADDALAALDAGVDDYILKPVRRSELILRTSALLRHAYPERKLADEAVQYGAFRFHTNTALVTRNSLSLELTQKEFELALLFFRNINRPLSRAFIQETVWSREPDVPSRTMDTHVSRIRSKLGLRPENGFRLAPVYSYGYKLEQTP